MEFFIIYESENNDEYKRMRGDKSALFVAFFLWTWFPIYKEMPTTRVSGVESTTWVSRVVPTTWISKVEPTTWKSTKCMVVDCPLWLWVVFILSWSSYWYSRSLDDVMLDTWRAKIRRRSYNDLNFHIVN